MVRFQPQNCFEIRVVHHSVGGRKLGMRMGNNHVPQLRQADSPEAPNYTGDRLKN